MTYQNLSAGNCFEPPNSQFQMSNPAFHIQVLTYWADEQLGPVLLHPFSNFGEVEMCNL